MHQSPVLPSGMVPLSLQISIISFSTKAMVKEPCGGAAVSSEMPHQFRHLVSQLVRPFGKVVKHLDHPLGPKD